MWEVSAVVDYVIKQSQAKWEQCRIIAYTIAQSTSTKDLKLTDILHFDWDKNVVAEIDNSEIERLRIKAKEREEVMNGKCINS